MTLRARAADPPGIHLLAPVTFWYEVANALWAAVRRKRLEVVQARTGLGALRDFAIGTCPADPGAALDLAFRHGLAVYDAAYLSGALEAGGVLWTLDRAMARAALAEGISVEPEIGR